MIEYAFGIGMYVWTVSRWLNSIKSFQAQSRMTWSKRNRRFRHRLWQNQYSRYPGDPFTLVILKKPIQEVSRRLCYDSFVTKPVQ